MAYECILTEVEDGVGIITLNRPEVLNAMNRQLVREMHHAMHAFEADDSVGCIVFTGAGEKAFSAGGDIHEQRSDDKLYTLDQQAAMSSGHSAYDVGACTKPTIGMMNGLAYGGAGVLSSSMDMRVGCEGTKFRFLAAAYGRINSTWSLPNQVGWPIAKELLFSARVVEAEEAHRIGLLNYLVPRSELRAKTMWLGKMIAGSHRGAVMGVKALMLKQIGLDLAGQYAAEVDYATNVMAGARAETAFPDFIARKGRPLPTA